jgi:uncharacterized protein (TIGR00730 family)
MRERKALMDAHASVFLILPGGIGTLEEFFEAWTSWSLGMHDKPVIVLDPGGFYQPLWQFVTAMIDAGFVRPEAWQLLRTTGSVDEAFKLIEG